MIDKFKNANVVFNQKQHPHNSLALTTQKTQLNSNNTILTKSGFVKYIKPNNL